MYAISPSEYKFADRDSCSLYFDLYEPMATPNDICVIYVFGGGFVMGERDSENNVEFYNLLTQRGFKVIAIDYRLGLKGEKNVNAFNPKAPLRAVRLATEDLVEATKYIIENAETLGVNPSKIALIGSSAGAITVLQTDYELANRTPIVATLPADFKYAAVVSMAGSIFSTKGSPKYASKPAPTLFYHGTKDKLVVYKKIQILKMGMFGTDPLTKIFTKQQFPYQAVRYKNAKHEVAEFPRTYCTDQIAQFLKLAAEQKYTNQIDITINDKFALENFKLELTRKSLYNGN